MPALTIALATAALSVPAAAHADADRYVVVLDDAADSAQVAADHGRRHGAEVSNVYRAALRGYAARIPAARLAAVRADSRVAYVAEDGVATTTAQTTPWGITKVGANLSSTRAGDGAGAVSGVNVYVLDTGVASHADINLAGHVNFAGGRNTDCNGHGTHVAGTIAAKDDFGFVVGVAPGAPVTGVKVLGCNGSGSYSGIIAGIDWVTANARKPAVANMSLGGSQNRALDDAVKRSAASGVTYAVAAGNETTDACTKSPAAAGTTAGVITVAATDTADREASFSNYGSCVDIWAPGVNILSTSRTGGTTTMSGTSMASPHVAGGAALAGGGSPSSVESALKSAAQSTGTTSRDGRAITREYVGGF
jgi:subtilisin family serine protease